MAVIAIVTGATSGIGRQFALQLKGISNIDELWLTGRNREALSEFSDEVAIEADISTDEGIDRIREKIEAERPEILFLINCAGLGYRAGFADQTPGMISDTIDVNCRALTLLTSVCIPYMKKGGSHIINVASSAGFIPQPGFSVYAASKSYVISFSRSLSRELKSSGITVTAVCPGPVRTGFQSRATSGKEDEFSGFRSKVAKEPDEIAKRSLKAAMSGRDVLVIGLSQKFLHTAAKIIPISWILGLIKW